jgi:hypothetical protein
MRALEWDINGLNQNVYLLFILYTYNSRRSSTLTSRWLSFAGRVFCCSERHHDFSLSLSLLHPFSSLLSAGNFSLLHLPCSITHSCLLGHDPSSLLSPLFRLLTFLFISFIANPPPPLAFHFYSRRLRQMPASHLYQESESIQESSILTILALYMYGCIPFGLNRTTLTA